MAEGYFIWGRTGARRVPRNRMMTRAALEHWLHQHLLKNCLPHRRPLTSDRPVHAPLNLTAFFRLVAHSHDVGYPAHWLSGILEAICTGSITTTARRPNRLTLQVEDVAKLYPQHTMSLGPWKTEFTTLLSLWRRLLPFGIIAPGLVPVEDIVECSITFPDFPHKAGRVPHFSLLFFNVSILTDKVDPLRLLQDDEEDSSEHARDFRDNMAHVVMNFQYVTDTRTATFWMRKDVVAKLKSREEWGASIFRTDSWKFMHPSLIATSTSLRVIGAWSQS